MNKTKIVYTLLLLKLTASGLFAVNSNELTVLDTDKDNRLAIVESFKEGKDALVEYRESLDLKGIIPALLSDVDQCFDSLDENINKLETCEQEVSDIYLENEASSSFISVLNDALDSLNYYTVAGVSLSVIASSLVLYLGQNQRKNDIRLKWFLANKVSELLTQGGVLQVISGSWRQLSWWTVEYTAHYSDGTSQSENNHPCPAHYMNGYLNSDSK